MVDDTKISPISTDMGKISAAVNDLKIHLAPAPTTPAAPERLRAYEDYLFGADCVRIRGQIERGYGSKFKDMTEPQHRHYRALEKLVVTEQAEIDARAALAIAEEANAAAEAEVTDSEADAHAAPSK